MNTIRPNTTTRLLTADQMSADQKLLDSIQVAVLAVVLLVLLAAVVVGGWLLAPGSWLS